MTHRVFHFLRESIASFLSDNRTLLAAAVSYNFPFSLFPFVLTLVSIAGFFMAPDGVRQDVVDGLVRMMPLGRDIITQAVQGIVDTRGITGFVALVMLLFSSASFFNTVRNSLNSAWGIRQNTPFLRRQPTNILMMTVAAIMLSASVALTNLPGLLMDIVNQWSVMPNRLDLLAQYTILSAGTLLEFTAFLLVYRFVPFKHRSGTRSGGEPCW